MAKNAPEGIPGLRPTQPQREADYDGFTRDSSVGGLSPAGASKGDRLPVGEPGPIDAGEAAPWTYTNGGK